MNIKDLVRPEVLNLPTINAPEVSEGMIRMNANESPASPWKKSNTIPLNRYPPIRPNSLTKKMAQFYRVSKNEILVSRGSTEAVDTIIRTFCRPNIDSILVSPPTFDMYQFFANLNSVAFEQVPLRLENNFALKIEDLTNAITKKTKLIFISTPNSPCGSSTTNEDIRLILEATKNSALVVVDEAYIEFSSLSSMINEINNYKNLIVLRTLSKAFSLAGARCGSMIASAEVINFLKKISPPFSFSTPAINHIEKVLSSNDLDANNQQIKKIIAEREQLKQNLSNLLCVNKVWQSDGNFLLVKFYSNDAVLNMLHKHHILVGQIKNNKVLENCLRITIGTPEENSALIEALSLIDF